MLYLKGDKGDDLPAQTGVQQVVTQGEIQELALPYHLFSGRLPFIFQSQVVMTEMPDGFRRCLMLNTLVVNSPCAVFLNALRQRPDVAKPAAVNIDKVEELAVVPHLLHGTLDSILKADALRRCDGCRLQQDQVVVAVGRFLQQVTGIVAHHLGKHIRREPGPHHRMSLQHQDYGVNAYFL